jgi:hypothetical protein
MLSHRDTETQSKSPEDGQRIPSLRLCVSVALWLSAIRNQIIHTGEICC